MALIDSSLLILLFVEFQPHPSYVLDYANFSQCMRIELEFCVCFNTYQFLQFEFVLIVHGRTKSCAVPSILFRSQKLGASLFSVELEFRNLKTFNTYRRFQVTSKVFQQTPIYEATLSSQLVVQTKSKQTRALQQGEGVIENLIGLQLTENL